MNEVTLEIGGRQFAVSCAEGEEDHVISLGRLIDAKVTGLGLTLSPNESRNFLFASLLIADELHDVRAELDRTSSEAAQSAKLLASLQERITPLEEQLSVMTAQAEDLTSQCDVLRIAADHAAQAQQKAQQEAEQALLAQAQAGDVLADMAADRDRLQQEVTALQGTVDKMTIELDGHKARIGAIAQERDTVRKESEEQQGKYAEMEDTLSRLQAEKETLGQELTALQDAPAPALPSGYDPDLAPALEKFADMLESCASRLEGKTVSTNGPAPEQ
ncbi:MAG: cell division protein ZapA [Sphingomonadaceae bacterium]